MRALLSMAEARLPCITLSGADAANDPRRYLQCPLLTALPTAATFFEQHVLPSRPAVRPVAQSMTQPHADRMLMSRALL